MSKAPSVLDNSPSIKKRKGIITNNQTKKLVFSKTFDFVLIFFLKIVDIPKTKAKPAKLDPNIVPNTIPCCPIEAPVIADTNSGIDDATATTNNPIIQSLNPNFLAYLETPYTARSEAFAIRNKLVMIIKI